MIDATALHRAADRVGIEAGTPDMDGLADAVADFIRESVLTDEFHVPFVVDTKSLGYGVLLGYLAALEEFAP
jgi:predicted ABC-type ATPase